MDFYLENSPKYYVGLYDVENGSFINRFDSAHYATANAFSKDNRLIASSSGHEVNVWDIQTNRLIQKIPVAHVQGRFVCDQGVVFSPDNKVIAFSSRDHRLTIHDIQTGNPIPLFEEPHQHHSSGIFGLEYSPNGEYVVTGSRDNTIKLWNLKDNSVKTLWAYERPANVIQSVNSVAFSEDGKQIFAVAYNADLEAMYEGWGGASNGIISIFDVEEGKITQSTHKKIPPECGNISSSAISNDHILIGYDAGYVQQFAVLPYVKKRVSSPTDTQRPRFFSSQSTGNVSQVQPQATCEFGL